MPTLTTQRQILTSHTAGVFNPLTDALPSVGFTQVRFRVWTAGVESGTYVVPAVQFSNDGVTWPDNAVALGTAVAVSEGWNYTSFEAWKNIYTDSALTSTTKRPFVRYGLIVTAAGGTAMGDAQLMIESVPVPSRVLRPPVSTTTTLANTDNNFQPLTEFIEVAGSEYARFTFELLSTSNQSEVIPAYQVANHPYVASGADARVAVGQTARYAVGTTYGTTFALWYDSTNFPDDGKKRLVRFGFSTRNFEGSNLEAIKARLVVELRDRAS